MISAGNDTPDNQLALTIVMGAGGAGSCEATSSIPVGISPSGTFAPLPAERKVQIASSWRRVSPPRISYEDILHRLSCEDP